MATLRKVTFTLNGMDVFGFPKMTRGDYYSGGQDVDYYMKERQGLFHCWGETIHTNEEGKPFQISCGIVEDEEGNIYQVPPTNIKFNK